MISKRLQELAHDRGWTMQQVATMANLPLETVRNIYYGKTPDPKISTVMKLAKVFNLSVNCFMGECSQSPAERVLMQHYRACGTHGKSVIELVAKYEASAVKSDREAPDKHTIPCLVPNSSICAGIVYDTCETKEIETTHPEAYVGIMMNNNDLAPIYCKNDIILFENRFPNNGEYAAFFKDGRTFIRQYIEEGDHYLLRCLHNQGSDLILRRMDEVDYIGTCIGVIRT